MSHHCRRNFWDRREFLFTSGGGISGLALAYLLGRDTRLDQPRLARLSLCEVIVLLLATNCDDASRDTCPQ